MLACGALYSCPFCKELEKEPRARCASRAGRCLLVALHPMAGPKKGNERILSLGKGLALVLPVPSG